MKSKILPALLLLFFTCFQGKGLSQNAIEPPYKNPELQVEQRIIDLLGRMSQEKIIQLQSMDGANMTPGNIDPDDTAMMRKMFGSGIGAIQATYIGINETVEIRNRIQRYLLENTRLGIPVLFIDEGLHGLLKPQATSFPQAIGLACSWDTKLFTDVYAVTAGKWVHGAHIML